MLFSSPSFLAHRSMISRYSEQRLLLIPRPVGRGDFSPAWQSEQFCKWLCRSSPRGWFAVEVVPESFVGIGVSEDSTPFLVSLAPLFIVGITYLVGRSVWRGDVTTAKYYVVFLVWVVHR